jgi:hypothetical protein
VGEVQLGERVLVILVPLPRGCTSLRVIVARGRGSGASSPRRRSRSRSACAGDTGAKGHWHLRAGGYDCLVDLVLVLARHAGTVDEELV